MTNEKKTLLPEKARKMNYEQEGGGRMKRE